jgi:hypothetical protein
LTHKKGRQFRPPPLPPAYPIPLYPIKNAFINPQEAKLLSYATKLLSYATKLLSYATKLLSYATGNEEK